LVISLTIFDRNMREYVRGELSKRFWWRSAASNLLP